MKIAIIGSGISGLSAAYILAPHAEVTLYEKQDRLGGHAHTHKVRFGDEEVSVDSGFMVFNPPEYPNFVALLAELGIDSIPAPMSFSVSAGERFEYGSDFPGGIFARAGSWFDVRFLRFLFSILRFNFAARRALRTAIEDSVSLEEFLKERGLLGDLAEFYLLPMIGSIWSCSFKDMLDAPAIEVLRFLSGHNLLDIVPPSSWRTIPGGSLRYVEAIRAALEKRGVKIFLNSSARVSRTEKGIIINREGNIEEYDHVIIATHADEALALLDDATEEERTILGAFTYSNNRLAPQ